MRGDNCSSCRFWRLAQYGIERCVNPRSRFFGAATIDLWGCGSYAPSAARVEATKKGRRR